jgi:hypothetical protein
MKPCLAGALAACAILMAFAPPARAIDLRKAGKLSIPANAEVVPFSTDPTVAMVLRQDFHAERRSASATAATPVTLTVSIIEQPLKPGVSLEDLAPGDPDVPKLLKEAGETPPPLGDTGVAPDQAAVARLRAQQTVPPDTITQSEQAANAMGGPFAWAGPMMAGPMMAGPMMGVPMMGAPMMGAAPAGGCLPGTYPCLPAAAATPRPQPGDPGYVGDTQAYMQQGSALSNFQGAQADNNNNYDRVIIARASTSGSDDEMTVLAVVHPGEDQRAAKRLVAEEIANAVLQ